MKYKFLLSVLALSFCFNSVCYAGGEWTELQKIIRRNKADTPEGSAARNKLALARMTNAVGNDVITVAKTVARLREVIDALGAETQEGARARCNLVLMWADEKVGPTGVTVAEALRLLGEVIRQQEVGTGQAVAARFLLVRMRLRNQFGDAEYTPQALIAHMREVVENFLDHRLRERQVDHAEARIRELELLTVPSPPVVTETAQERELKRIKVRDEEAERARIAEIDARLFPVTPFPPPLTNGNDNNAAPQDNADAAQEPQWGTLEAPLGLDGLFFENTNIAIDYSDKFLYF